MEEKKEDEIGAEKVSPDELFQNSDIVSIHVPLNANTRHLIGENEIKKMKKTEKLSVSLTSIFF